MAKVLIIDDDESLCKMLQKLVEKIEHQAEYAITLAQGLEKAKSEQVDVVFLDVQMPDGSGLEILEKLRDLNPAPEVIIITGAGDPDGAEIAIKNGAWDYLQKPLSPKRVLLPIKRVLQYRDNLKKVQKPAVIFNREGIIGNSESIKICLDKLANAANSEANVLITGETGTGKEIFAKALHENSSRSGKNFIVVDCAALPETLVESYLFGHEKGSFTGADRSKEGLVKLADGGTLFLDEIGELSLSLQKAFLRVLQEKIFRPVGGKEEVKSDFRLVAATNKNLEHLVEENRFRNDLLFRLRAVTIELPPLRMRKEDIKELVVYYLDKISQKYAIPAKGFSPDFIDILIEYSWPGNVRELIHILESTLTQAQHEPILFSKHLPSNLRVMAAKASLKKVQVEEQGVLPESAPKTNIREFDTVETMLSYKDYREQVLGEAEKEYLIQLIELTRGNIKEACRVSNLGRTRLYDLMKKHDISKLT